MGGEQPRVSRAVALVVGLVGVFLSWGAQAGDLRGWFLDVGQGDAALFVSPSGQVLLVDAGPRGADDEIQEAMRDAGVSHIDVVVLTHAHLDHIGGLKALLGDVQIGRVIDSGFMHPTKAYQSLLKALEDHKVPMETGRKGLSIELGGGVSLGLLGPSDPLLSGTRSDPNSNSIIARLVHGEVSVLLTGDAEAPTESRLMAEGEPLEATVLKIAHHGSDHATSLSFLDASQPKVGVVSCGRNNKYGHPAPGLMQRLARKRVPLHRTDRGGTVAFRSDGTSWALESSEASRTTKDKASEGSADVALNTPVSQPPPLAPPAHTDQAQASSEGLVNVNTADLALLDTLPGIGPKKAALIIEAREVTPFSSIDDLARVRGIGPKTVERLRPLVTVGQPSP